MSDWRNTINMVTNKIKHHLYSNRKADHINHINKWVQEFDQQNTGLMTRYDFEQFLRKIGIFLTSQELRCIYNDYSIVNENNPSKLVSYQLILDDIKVDMSEFRLSLIKNAFQFLDQSRSGKIPLQVLFQKYQSQEHPRARTLQKTTEQVQQEFEQQILLKSADGQNISEQEFLSYYSDLNLTHANEKEDYFEDLIIRTWAITSGQDYVSQERIADLEIILYEKIRQKTVSKTDEGNTARSTFRYFDLADTGLINYEQFVKAVTTYGCTFNDKELGALFNKYDVNNSGQIDFKEFSKLFAGIGSGFYPNINPIFDEMKKVPEGVMQEIQQTLQNRGVSAQQLGEAFEKFDVKGFRFVDREAFQKVLSKFGIILKKESYNALYRHYDNNYKDQINYIEFTSYF